MKRITLVIALLLFAVPVMAQENTPDAEPTLTATPDLLAMGTPVPTGNQWAWCGYVLIEGVVIELPELGMIETVTAQADSPNVLPDELMQYRFDRTGERVIVEACWTSVPTATLIASLIEQVSGASYDEIIASMTYTQFAGTREQSAESVRGYLDSGGDGWACSFTPDDSYATYDPCEDAAQ